jgi:hypothetical protein
MIPLFQPSHNLKLVWDTIILILVLMLCYLIPIYCAFGINLNYFLPFGLNTGVIGLMLLIDLLVTLNTCVYDSGVLVCARRTIFSIYYERNMIADVIANIVIWLHYFYEG